MITKTVSKLDWTISVEQ